MIQSQCKAAVEELTGLIQVELEIGSPKLHELACGSEPRNIQGWIPPGGDHELDRPGSQLDEAAYLGVAVLVRDEVVVVEDENELLAKGFERGRQRPRGVGCPGGCGEATDRPIGGCRGGDRSGDVGPQHGAIVVLCVEPHPCKGTRIGRGPFGQDGRLAEAWRGDEQGESGTCGPKAVAQATPADRGRPDGRRVKLGRMEHGPGWADRLGHPPAWMPRSCRHALRPPRARQCVPAFPP